MRESTIECALCKRIELLGGMCEKFVSPNRRAVPDRLVSLPAARIVFVELKAPGKSPTPAQLRDHARRRALGFEVLIIDSLEAIDNAFPL